MSKAAKLFSLVARKKCEKAVPVPSLLAGNDVSVVGRTEGCELIDYEISKNIDVRRSNQTPVVKLRKYLRKTCPVQIT